MKTIKLLYKGFPHQAFSEAQAGSVWRLFIHGLRYPPELRAAPPPRASARGLAPGPRARRAARPVAGRPRVLAAGERA